MLAGHVQRRLKNAPGGQNFEKVRAQKVRTLIRGRPKMTKTIRMKNDMSN